MADSIERLTEHTWLLAGGGYPDANALLVEGKERTVLVDAPLCLLGEAGDALGDDLPAPDEVILSHCHEDHVPGLDRDSLRELPCWVHEDDYEGLASVDGFLDFFGMPEPGRSRWRETVQRRFHFRPRPDAKAYGDGHRWDLGGTTITASHTPGHTRGHCSLRVEPDDVVFLGDIDLSGFGPYYGDAASSLEEFEETLERISHWRARWFVTGHHIGAVDQETYDARLKRYSRRIAEREAALLEYLTVPRTMEEMVDHRFVYRPKDEVVGMGWIEERSIGQHLERLAAEGRVVRRGEAWQVASGRLARP